MEKCDALMIKRYFFLCDARDVPCVVKYLDARNDKAAHVARKAYYGDGGEVWAYRSTTLGKGNIE